MKKKIVKWDLFVAETMTNLVELESALRNLSDEARDAHLNIPHDVCQQTYKYQLASMCTLIGAVQEKLADTIKALFQLDLTERKCETFVSFQLANGNWEYDFLTRDDK